MRLPGLNDVEIEYEASPGDPKKAEVASSKIPASMQVDLRLLRARVPATVTPHGNTTVRVTVDQQLVEPAERNLAWRGGLMIYRLDASHTLESGAGVAPPPQPNATLNDYLRAAERTEDSTHRLLFNAVVTGASLRVVKKEPLFDGSHSPLVAAEGKRLVVEVNDRDRATLERVAGEAGDEPVAFARGFYVLWIGPLKDRLGKSERGNPAILIPRGEDILAYSRARKDARLLGPPVFALSLKETARAKLPRNVPLAAGCVIFPVLAGFLWLLFVRRFDRARPEPWWLMLATALLGGFSGELAGFIEHRLRLLTPYLDPDVMTLDGSAKVFPITLLVYSITVGAVEEGAKLLATWVLARRRREFDEPVDGMLYACAAAIGFAVDENISYFAGYRLAGGLVATRSIDCIAAHTMLSAIWGYALGKALIARKADRSARWGARLRLVRYFLLAAVLHGATDTAITFHVPHSTLFFNVGCMTLFFFLLRKTLRWGTVDELRGEAPASTTRLLFRTGGGAPLGGSIALLYLSAAAITFFGRVVDADHGRVSFLLLFLMMLFLVLLGFAAFAVTRTIPLDVAIDELGVTFAGSLRRWPSIDGTTRVGRDRMFLHSKDGNLLIGSMTEGTRAEVEATIHEKKKARGEDLSIL